MKEKGRRRDHGKVDRAVQTEYLLPNVIMEEEEGFFGIIMLSRPTYV